MNPTRPTVPPLVTTPDPPDRPGRRVRSDRPASSTAAGRRQALGRFGEDYAARYLGELGMVVLDRNWRCDLGEIDLVLREDRVLVVCEVKTRSSTAFGSPLEAVGRQKAARLRRLAARWLVEHPLHPPEVRIDVVGVLVAPGSSPELEHLRGIG